MFGLRGLTTIFAAGALATSMASVAHAGWCNGYYGCGPGNYGYGYSSGVPFLVYPAPIYVAPAVYPRPRRYVVDQGPDFTGPNVTFFYPRSWHPGVVDTFAYPYVGRRAASAYVRRHHWHRASPGYWR
jgi:hypothetical protein